MNHPLTPQAALGHLLAGHRRYLEGRMAHPHQDARWRASLTREQHPVAAVLGCADSRVPPQIIFDQGLGDLFTNRVAGNIVDDAILASLTYGVVVLGVPLIVVLGHTGCGAVAAAATALEEGDANPSLTPLMRALEPALQRASGRHDRGEEAWGCRLTAAVKENVNVSVHLVAAHPPLAARIAQHTLAVVGAVYDLETGGLEVLPTPASPSALSTHSPLLERL
jgi:carbonic anhydrase